MWSQVNRLVRHTPGPGEVWWVPDAGEIDSAGLDGFDGVVHLATMPWPMRWTAKAKQMIRANRLRTNHLLAESLAGCAHKPQVLICASGMRYYAEFSPEERQNPPAVFNYSLPPPDEHINVWEDDFSKMHSPSWWERLFRIPSLIAGIGLLKQRGWARVLALIVAILALTSFPIGTAAGVYTLWVLTHKETQQLLGAAV